jgi:hypothetical protein
MTEKEIIADRKRHQKKLNIERFKRFLWFLFVFISIYLLCEFYDRILFVLPLLLLQFHTYKKLKKIDHRIRILKLCVMFLEVAEDPSDKSKVKEVVEIFRKH